MTDLLLLIAVVYLIIAILYYYFSLRNDQEIIDLAKDVFSDLYPSDDFIKVILFALSLFWPLIISISIEFRQEEE